MAVHLRESARERRDLHALRPPFVASSWRFRSQATIGSACHGRVMFPDHSIAILTSEQAQILDPRVRDLTDRIIDAHRAERDGDHGR